MLLVLAALAASVLAPPAARAELLIGNLNIGTASSSSTSTEGLNLSGGVDIAQAFTTGSADFGYTLESVELFFVDDMSSTDIADLTVTLRAADSTEPLNPATTALATFTKPDSIDGEDDADELTADDKAVFTAPAGTTLAANTTYFVMLEYGSGDITNFWRQWKTEANGEEAGGAAGWSIADEGRAKGNSSWYGVADKNTLVRASFYIRVNGTEKANNPPEFDPDTATRTTSEGSPPGTALLGGAIPEADDADDHALSYRMEGTDAASFDFNATTRVITAKAGVTYDFETKDSYEVTIRADDGNGGSGTLTVTINLLDVTEPPREPAAPTVRATPGSNTSLDVSWTPPANTGPPILHYDVRYRRCTTRADCENHEEGPQDVVGLSTTITGLEPDTLYAVFVRATNDEGDGVNSASGYARTILTDVNQPPSPSPPPAAPAAPVFADATLTRSLAENTAANENVGAVIPEATDANGDDLTYSMEGPDAGSFEFNDETRQITTKEGVSYDFEAKSSYSVTIKVVDGNGGEDTVAVTISLTDVNEPPSAPAAPAVRATSGSSTSLDVSWTAPANDGKPDIESYDLQYREGTSGNFTNGPQNVTGTSATIPNLDEGTSYQVQVRATNDEGAGDWSASGRGSTRSPGDVEAARKAWVAGFGLAVVDQVLDAIDERLAAAPARGVSVSLGGRSLPRLDGGDWGSVDAAVREEAEAQDRLAALSRWLAWEEDGGRRDRAVTADALLWGTSFSMEAQGGDDRGGAVWGEGVVSRFGNRQGAVSFDGEVGSALLGASVTRGAATLGLLAGYSRGHGEWRVGLDEGGGQRGTAVTTLKGLYPFARYRFDRLLSVWAVAGHGEGRVTLTPEEGEALGSDMKLSVAAAGLRRVARAAPSGGGVELGVKSDALSMFTTAKGARSGDGEELSGTRAYVTRVRLGLDGVWRGLRAGSGRLAPRAELGVRHDDGDTATGFGLVMGGGLSWSDEARGLSAAVNAQGLVAHEAGGRRDRGISGSLRLQPDASTGRGPSLALSHSLGGRSSGGAEALLARESLAGLAEDGGGPAGRRLELTLGHGFAAFANRFTATPEFALGLSDGQRRYRLGWHLRLAGAAAPPLALGLEALRSERTGKDRGADHAIQLSFSARW